jgi:predicted  nucleic acid-binding Zn-ribbon protein
MTIEWPDVYSDGYERGLAAGQDEIKRLKTQVDALKRQEINADREIDLLHSQIDRLEAFVKWAVEQRRSENKDFEGVCETVGHLIEKKNQLHILLKEARTRIKFGAHSDLLKHIDDALRL